MSLSRTVSWGLRVFLVGFAAAGGVAAVGDTPVAARAPSLIAELEPIEGVDFIWVTALNNRGQAVGAGVRELQDEPGLWTGLSWRSTAPILLRVPEGARGTWPHAINNRGLIAGETDFGDRTQATLWRKGKPKLLPELPDGLGSTALALNDRGQAAGTVLTADDYWLAAVWTGRRLRTLPPLPETTHSEAHALNNRGKVAGVSLTFSEGTEGEIIVRRATSWHGRHATALGEPEGTTESDVLDLNDRGDVVGWAAGDSGMVLPAAWSKRGPRLLPLPEGAIGGMASAVDSRGRVVGWVGDDNGVRMLLWTARGTFDLSALVPESLGWTTLFPEDLNDRGEIVGQGDLNGKRAAFRLRIPKRLLR
ncbi:MAG: hypothetical protein ACK47B_00085 [Armatimonadota bacterium]